MEFKKVLLEVKQSHLYYWDNPVNVNVQVNDRPQKIGKAILYRDDGAILADIETGVDISGQYPILFYQPTKSSRYIGFITDIVIQEAANNDSLITAIESPVTIAEDSNVHEFEDRIRAVEPSNEDEIDDTIPQIDGVEIEDITDEELDELDKEDKSNPDRRYQR